ncbi:hypothetical protein [Nocardioides okcheonensis]|uniref:hypothetical protein n=1 Tax=Nocardioides okcheonensis TaxID=2894081 RepID=UPI001E635345|nr:hypothetical protein [Nocardioides okcheonensis]UFN46156.1 hypothetical protein LN652_08135 [Nocardioides okcheonensis]
MATVTIPAVGVEVTTDLAFHPQLGDPVQAVSAAGPMSATALALADNVYHRINPYFIRPSHLTDTVEISYDCEHRPSNSVMYSENGTAPTVKWSGKTEVDSTRTRSKNDTIEASLHRKITATEVPPQAVSRTIVCKFGAVKYFDTRTQAWVKMSTATGAPPSCQVTFDLHP